MDMRLATRELRLSYWTGVLQERQASGQSIRAWCQANGVVEKTYHHWKRKLREAAYEQYVENHAESGAPAPAFAEVRMIEVSPQAAESESTTPCQLHVKVAGVCITADSGYPAEKLAALLRELARPC